MRLVARPGFTLVELIVAVLLIDVGVLALVAGSALVVRRQTEIRIRASASRAAANRLQVLEAGRCIAVSGSASIARGMTEEWSAESRPNGTRELRDSVFFTVAGAPHHVVLRTRVPC